MRRPFILAGLAALALAVSGSPASAFVGFYATSREVASFESLEDRGVEFEEVACSERPPDLVPPFEISVFTPSTASVAEIDVSRQGSLTLTSSRAGVGPVSRAVIAPFRGELGGGRYDCPRIRYATTGSAPNRTFIVELSNFTWRSADYADKGAFQVAFTEGASFFEVAYGGSMRWGRRHRRPYPPASARWESTRDPTDPRGHFAPCSVNAACDDDDFNDELSGHRFRVTKAIEPELRSVAFELPPGAFPGEAVKARLTIENNGEEAAVGVDVAVHASIDAQVSPGVDRRLVSVEDVAVLDPLGTQMTIPLSFELPPDLPVGARLYVYGLVDPMDEQRELVETDNAWSSEVPNFSTGYDLEVTGCRVSRLPSDGSPGEPIGFEVDLASVGVPYDGEIEVELWAAQGPVLDAGRDVSLGRGTVALRAEEPETTITVEGELPADGLAVGGYFPACVADPRDLVPEVEGAELNRRVGEPEERFYVPPARLEVVPDEALPDAHVATPYEYEVQFTGGGFSREQVSFTADYLPAGLEITPRGLIRGEAREVTSSEGRSIVVEARAGGDIDRERFTLRVLPPEPLVFAPADLPAGTRGRDYEAKLDATGGVGEPVFRLSGGALPEGLGLSGEGWIRGRPLELGSFEIEVSVTDAPPRGVAVQERSRSFELAVVDEALVLTRTSIPPARVGRRYDARIEARPTSGPLAWSFRAEPGVPAGMTMGPSPDGSLFWIRGVPEATGQAAVELEVRDLTGRRGAGRFELVVEPGPDPEDGPAVFGSGSGGCASTASGLPGPVGALLAGVWLWAARRRRARPR